MTRCFGWVVCLLLAGAGILRAQGVDAANGASFSPKYLFGVMGEYSNDSSHIILGESDNVKLGAVGVQYQRRLIANRRLVFSYAMEFRPGIIQSNPTATFTEVQTFPFYFKYSSTAELTTKCVASAVQYHVARRDPPAEYSGVDFTTCGRAANYALGIAPFGMRLNFRPHSRVQPTVSTFEGIILSTKPLPIAAAGSFNFAFEIGAGIEYYRTEHTSVRLEFQVQHYSNDYTAGANPGVDSGMVKVTYSFGR